MPGIGDDQAHVVAGLDLVVLEGKDRVGRHGHERRPDGKLAAVGHRVAGVQREVEQHLLDLPHVGADGLAVGSRLDP